MKKTMHPVYALLFALAASSCSPKSDIRVSYYRSGEFLNLHQHAKKSFYEYALMRLRTSQKKWPEYLELKNKSVKPEPRSIGPKIYYINHSTFLIQAANTNILTDPVFSERTSPVSWAGPKRVIDPGIRKENLPKIDVILISHDHYDHLDIESLKWLSKRDRPKILLGLKAGRVFKNEDFTELKWWETYQHKTVSYTFTPAQHFSGRTLFDRNSTLWGAFVVEVEDLVLYFGGDTGFGPHFENTQKRFPTIDIALLPIGAYAPRSFMGYHHMDPPEAIKAHQVLKSKFALGMHWGTFQLTNEGREDPKNFLNAEASKKGVETFLVPENGDCFRYIEEIQPSIQSC